MTTGKADVVVGIQWGDEGKGRIVDLYARDYDIVARFGGGDNAGHSIIVGDRKLALRIVPSGVLQPQCELFIGAGTVVSLAGLIAELDNLSAIGVDVSRIKISNRAHVVFPYHAASDRANERARGDRAIGTTGRGIGPAYVDKAARAGITFGELRRKEVVADKIRANLAARAASLDEEVPAEDDLVASTMELAERILPHVVDGVRFIHEALESGRRMLVEGAQGSLLDVGFGTYPFVTSSHTIAGGACIGLGIGPLRIGSVTGVVKAYTTRVGAGPFPSELHDEHGERLRRNGREFGVVTGRPRRCGWLDAVALQYARRINGLSAAVVTKLDVLSGFDRIGIVTGYRLHGSSVGFEAADDPALETAVEYFEGWNGDLSSARSLADLPDSARTYVARLQDVLGVPIEAISVGPERSQLIDAR